MEKRSAQLKLSFFSHSTDEEFILNPRLVGDRVFDPGETLPYPFGGESVSRAYLVEVRYGAFSYLEVAVRGSFYDLRFNDDGGNRRNTGIGDLFADAIVQVIRNPLAVSARVGVKAPTGEFDIDPERVPLGEDQWDVEGALAVGKSFYPLPAYASAEAGYRIRFENDQTKISPGDEFFFTGETGVTLAERVLLKVAVEGLFAQKRESREFGFVVRNREGRKLVSVAPYASIDATERVSVEAGVKFLVAGREYPAGVQFVAAVSWRFLQPAARTTAPAARAE